MNTENEMNEDVRQLLDSLEEHGKNARRQQQLSDLIDGLSGKELRTTSRRRLVPLWWAMGAAAALLLLWLLVNPTVKQNSNINEEIFVEETGTVDTVIIKVNDEVQEEPVAEERLLAEENPQNETHKSGLLRSARNDETEKHHEGIAQEQLIAEVRPTESSEPQEPTDTANIGSNNIPDAVETPSAVQSRKRRVIRSLNLVCYECQKAPEIHPQSTVNFQLSTVNYQLSTTVFGQPQDPNMKNGTLAFEFKLN